MLPQRPGALCARRREAIQIYESAGSDEQMQSLAVGQPAIGGALRGVADFQFLESHASILPGAAAFQEDLRRLLSLASRVSGCGDIQPP